MDTLSNFSQTEYNYGNKLEIAIVGAGRAGYFHLHSLLRFSSFKLKYIVDMDLEKAHKLQTIYGGESKATNKISDVLEDPNVKAVIVATSTPSHFELTKWCLLAGKNVLCEKPLDKARECFEIANQNKLNLLVAYHKRFDTNYQKIIQKIKMNSGIVKNIKMTLKDNFIPPLSYLKTSGGIVLDMLTHDIDIINLLMNFEIPLEVVALSHTRDKGLLEAGEIEDIEVLLKYKSGELVSITSSRQAGYGYDHRMEVVGSLGMFQLRNDTDDLVNHYTDQGGLASKIKYNFPERFKEAYLNEINYFYHMIEHNYPCLILPEHIELNHQICDLINQSLLEKKIVSTSQTTTILRNYEEDTPQYEFYQKQHQTQSLAYVETKLGQYQTMGRLRMTMHQALEMLDDFIDPSDPDVDLPNSVHAYQTAERIRKARPLQEKLQLTGLIHDLGKVLFKFGEESHTVVGDTYVVGCPFPESIVFYDTMKQNPDWHDTSLHTGTGIYHSGCGIENLKISFGHDEYLYLVLQHNKNHKLDKKYQNIIRFHSLYPWHTGKAYLEFMTASDSKLLEDVLDFNQFDLYSKEDTAFVLTDEIKEYYRILIDKYFPTELEW